MTKKEGVMPFEEKRFDFSDSESATTQFFVQNTAENHLSFSFVSQNDLQHLFLVAEFLGTDNAADNTTGNAGDSMQNQFDWFQAVLIPILNQHGMTDSVLTISIFLPDLGQKQFFRQKFRQLFGEHLPAMTYIPQTSCFGKNVIFELYAVSPKLKNEQNFEIKRFDERSVQWTANGITHLFCSDIRPDETPLSSYERSLNAFSKLQAILMQRGYGIPDLYRTWLYQGHIVDAEGATQRYKELNRARTDIFGERKFLANFLPQSFEGVAFPASTGIGADDYDLVISAQAVQSDRKDLIFVPLENPLQVSAFRYAKTYSPKSPKFSRAMAFVAGSDAMVYISGTASITASESRYLDDAGRQTHQTLDNIAALVSQENLANHGIHGFHASLDQVAIARVYVKNASDFPVIRQVCEQRLGNIPLFYVFADVCRPELLVEVEGIIVPRSCSCPERVLPTQNATSNGQTDQN
ncbi:MAG: hypothetical protein FWC50_15030 [Planctomycetaceae bacterium]|nr:hypothetical protein [Planctomycetaceae bacterium]